MGDDLDDLLDEIESKMTVRKTKTPTNSDQRSKLQPQINDKPSRVSSIGADMAP